MDFLSKVQWVKDFLKGWQEENGDEFNYVVLPRYRGEDDAELLMGIPEHREIIKYLAHTGYIEIAEEKSPTSLRIKILPKTKPPIRLKTLELIARALGDINTANSLIDFLIDCGVDRKFVIYPNTKWRMVYAVLVELACSKNSTDQEILWKIIGDAVHPITHNGNKDTATALREKFNEYLSYDNMHIELDERNKVYKVVFEPSAEQEDEITEHQVKSMEEDNEKELEFLCTQENKERISSLRQAYRLLMNVVFEFCKNPSHPTVELNDDYQFLYRFTNQTISELKLWQTQSPNSWTPFSRSDDFFQLPFSNLFSAEKVYQNKGKELSWQKIRPDMNAMYGDIETIYHEVNGSDIIAEPDTQKKFNEIQLHLSERKEKENAQKQKEAVLPPSPIHRVEIVSGNLEVGGLRDGLGVLVKKSNKEPRPATNHQREDSLPVKEPEPEITIGKLVAFTDGSISYAGNNLILRNQLKDLCRLFMRRPNRLITIDDVKDNLIAAEKRKTTPNDTISKYVSELRVVLKNCFGNDVIQNQKEEGWYFKPLK